MVRSYEDVVDVRGGPAGGASGGSFAPHQFLWRGRLYVVRDVLSHWFERSAWWEGVAAQAARGECGGPGEHGTDEGTGTRKGARTRDGTGAAAVGGSVLCGTEREVWRVEASPGRTAGSGVYDLCALPSGSPHASGWRLLQVSD